MKHEYRHFVIYTIRSPDYLRVYQFNFQVISFIHSSTPNDLFPNTVTIQDENKKLKNMENKKKKKQNSKEYQHSSTTISQFISKSQLGIKYCFS